MLRKFQVRSEPPGAELRVDGVLVGTTPWEREFVTYGSHRLELRLPGYERLVTVVDLERPWWQVFPVSFVTDVLWPFELRDVHAFELALEPLGAGGDWDAARAAYERLRAARQRVADELDGAPSADPARDDAPAGDPPPGDDPDAGGA